MAKMLNIKQLMEKYGVKSRTTIYNNIKAGKISKPVKKFGSSRWCDDDLDKSSGKSKN